MRGRIVATVPAAARTIEANAVLPPGQSGHVSLTGVPTGTGSPHPTDQVDELVEFRYRPFDFG